MSANLVSRFASAGLDLRLAPSPFAASAAEIFQLDIRRLRSHDAGSEHFLCWPGGEGGNVCVSGVDRSERQLVLMVHEGRREFEEAIPPFMWKGSPHAPGSPEWRSMIAGRAGIRSELIIVTKGGGAAVRRETSGSTRHMLVGRDERQLFMCELPRAVTSVKAAHDALRVPEAKRKKGSKSALDAPIRQGEWFFLVLKAEEHDEIAKALSGSRAFIRRRVAINHFIPRWGKPHLVDELVVLGASPRPRGDVQPDIRIYVRGAVRHPDHKTIHITQWRRVLKNLEVSQSRSVLGGTWVD